MSSILFLLVFVVAAVLVLYAVRLLVTALKLDDPARMLVLVVTVVLLLLWLLEHFNLVPAL